LRNRRPNERFILDGNLTFEPAGPGAPGSAALIRALLRLSRGRGAQVDRRADIRIEAVAIANLNDAPSPPCGACRQVLGEFILPDAPVIFPATGGDRTMSFSELLPLAFDMKLK